MNIDKNKSKGHFNKNDFLIRHFLTNRSWPLQMTELELIEKYIESLQKEEVSSYDLSGLFEQKAGKDPEESYPSVKLTDTLYASCHLNYYSWEKECIFYETRYDNMVIVITCRDNYSRCEIFFKCNDGYEDYYYKIGCDHFGKISIINIGKNPDKPDEDQEEDLYDTWGNVSRYYVWIHKKMLTDMLGIDPLELDVQSWDEDFHQLGFSAVLSKKFPILVPTKMPRGHASENGTRRGV